MVLSAREYVLFDGTVFEQHRSWHIELVCRQYSSSVHSVMVGIGLITRMYVNFETNLFWLIDYRLFAYNGRTKLEHVADMLTQLALRGIPYRTVLTAGMPPYSC